MRFWFFTHLAATLMLLEPMVGGATLSAKAKVLTQTSILSYASMLSAAAGAQLAHPQLTQKLESPMVLVFL
jgi:hypothetical protein